VKPFKIYSGDIEQGALDQFFSAMELDFVVRGALMPDAHQGYTLPIGAVVATDGWVMPSWVGYDIGCGMCALPTTFEAKAVTDMANEIHHGIHRAVPVGFHVHDEPFYPRGLEPDHLTDLGREAFDKRKGFRSIGTLGGGNHFIELASGDDGKVWIIIHSGSRGVGHGIATAYMRAASPDGKVREGHYGFPCKSEQGGCYINDSDWALQFALENRRAMALGVVNVLTRYLDGEALWEELINRNHNHVEYRHGMWIHRKGATHAEEGMMGVIPGNMRDGSFIVRGRGSSDALWSSSHGAGRKMGRREAKRKLDVEEFRATMTGIKATVSESTLDEAPMAYKNIFEVMRLQGELVEVVRHLLPILNVKG